MIELDDGIIKFFYLAMQKYIKLRSIQRQKMYSLGVIMQPLASWSNVIDELTMFFKNSYIFVEINRSI